MTTRQTIGLVEIGAAIEFVVAGEPTPLTVDGDGVLQLDFGAGSMVVVEDGAQIRGIAVVENGDPWEPTDGAYMWILRAASTFATVHLEDVGVPPGQRITSPGSPSSFFIGANAVQIFFRPSASRWVIPNWSPWAIGEVKLFAPTGSLPLGWIEADGSTPLLASYPLLGAVLGTTYGGDGVTTFGLPGSADLPALPGGSAVRYTIFAGE